MPANTSKRPRIDNADNPVLKDIQDEEIWMSDGNIVVAVVDEAKGERHLYKCHRGLLSKSLPVLGEMFEADHSSGCIVASASEHYEGTPVVRLYDESAHVQQLLQVIYNPSKLPYKWWVRGTMDELAGLLRLTRKYEAEDLYKRCVAVFQSAWPTTLHEWEHRNKDALERIKNEEEVRKLLEESQYYWNEDLPWELPDPGTAVSIAHEHDLHASCATAFYALHEAYRTPYIVEPDVGMPYEHDIFPDRLPVSIESLSAGLLRQFVRGREYLRYIGWRLISDTLPMAARNKLERIHRDSQGQNCEDAIKAWWDARFMSLAKAGMEYSTDPLGMLDNLGRSLQEKTPINDKICDRCRPRLQHCIQQTRKFLWRKLPACFQVDGIVVDNFSQVFQEELCSYFKSRDFEFD